MPIPAGYLIVAGVGAVTGFVAGKGVEGAGQVLRFGALAGLVYLVVTVKK